MYLLIILHQTATLNLLIIIYLRLYLLIILHQTATSGLKTRPTSWLYLLIILHQTATCRSPVRCVAGCIFLSSYIKPQLLPVWLLVVLVVSSYHPTSNSNQRVLLMKTSELYLLIILHQTATAPESQSD